MQQCDFQHFLSDKVMKKELGNNGSLQVEPQENAAHHEASVDDVAELVLCKFEDLPENE